MFETRKTTFQLFLNRPINKTSLELEKKRITKSMKITLIIFVVVMTVVQLSFARPSEYKSKIFIEAGND
jgi:hypothetical protein